MNPSRGADFILSWRRVRPSNQIDPQLFAFDEAWWSLNFGSSSHPEYPHHILRQSSHNLRICAARLWGPTRGNGTYVCASSLHLPASRSSLNQFVGRESCRESGKETCVWRRSPAHRNPPFQSQLARSPLKVYRKRKRNTECAAGDSWHVCWWRSHATMTGMSRYGEIGYLSPRAGIHTNVWLVKTQIKCWWINKQYREQRLKYLDANKDRNLLQWCVMIC